MHWVQREEGDRQPRRQLQQLLLLQMRMKTRIRMDKLLLA